MKLKSLSNIISKEFFQMALVSYLLLTLAETLRQGFVSNFFNMNYLLVVVLCTGVIMVLSETQEQLIKYRRRVSRAVIVLSIRAYKRELAERLKGNRLAFTPQPPAIAYTPRPVSDIMPRRPIDNRVPERMYNFQHSKFRSKSVDGILQIAK